MLSFRLTWLGGRAFLLVWNARSMMHIHNPEWVPTATFVITAQSSKDCTLMHLLRCIQLFCAVDNFKLRAEHIPRYSNMPADTVSCSHLKVFFKVPPPGAQTSHANSCSTVELPIRSAARVEVTRLEKVAEDLIADSLAPCSCRAYQVSQSEFVQFCHRLSGPPPPRQHKSQC